MAMKLDTIILDGQRLLDTRRRLQEGGSDDLERCLGHLKGRADKWLTRGPWHVMEKTKLPPSGDRHDYTSQAPYWWPSENSADGSPYVKRDGLKNPEVLDYPDRNNVEDMFNASGILGLAWLYTGEEAYGRHCGTILRTWFVAPETRMNPNLNHAQLIPFAETGRHIGIIDFSQSHTTVLDVVAMLERGGPSGGRAPGWTEEDSRGFRAWNREFLGWLRTSEFGRLERAEENNHGVFARLLVAGIAAFLGEEAAAREEVLAAQGRLDGTISREGRMRCELERTRSWHYTLFALLGWTRLAMLGARVGVDVWGYEGARGGSIVRAVELVIPAATGREGWGFPEVEFHRYIAADVVRAAADAGSEAARGAVRELAVVGEEDGGDLWELRPAPEQLRPLKVDGKMKAGWDMMTR